MIKRQLLILLAPLLLLSCGGVATPVTTSTKTTTDRSVNQANQVEVIYFHGRQRCATCNEIERLARALVDSIADQNVVMTTVDISTDEGEKIAELYSVNWSSLLVQHDDTVENLTDMAFLYAKSQPDLFKERLLNSIKDFQAE